MVRTNPHSKGNGEVLPAFVGAIGVFFHKLLQDWLPFANLLTDGVLGDHPECNFMGLTFPSGGNNVARSTEGSDQGASPLGSQRNAKNCVGGDRWVDVNSDARDERGQLGRAEDAGAPCSRASRVGIASVGRASWRPSRGGPKVSLSFCQCREGRG